MEIENPNSNEYSTRLEKVLGLFRIEHQVGSNDLELLRQLYYRLAGCGNRIPNYSEKAFCSMLEIVTHVARDYQCRENGPIFITCMKILRLVIFNLHISPLENQEFINSIKSSIEVLTNSTRLSSMNQECRILINPLEPTKAHRLRLNTFSHGYFAVLAAQITRPYQDSTEGDVLFDLIRLAGELTKSRLPEINSFRVNTQKIVEEKNIQDITEQLVVKITLEKIILGIDFISLGENEDPQKSKELYTLAVNFISVLATRTVENPQFLCGYIKMIAKRVQYICDSQKERFRNAIVHLCINWIELKHCIYSFECLLFIWQILNKKTKTFYSLINTSDESLRKFLTNLNNGKSMLHIHTTKELLSIRLFTKTPREALLDSSNSVLVKSIKLTGKEECLELFRDEAPQELFDIFSLLNLDSNDLPFINDMPIMKLADSRYYSKEPDTGESILQNLLTRVKENMLLKSYELFIEMLYKVLFLRIVAQDYCGKKMKEFVIKKLIQFLRQYNFAFDHPLLLGEAIDMLINLKNFCKGDVYRREYCFLCLTFSKHDRSQEGAYLFCGACMETDIWCIPSKQSNPIILENESRIIEEIIQSLRRDFKSVSIEVLSTLQRDAMDYVG